MQSSSQIITTNEPTSSFFMDRMPFLSPNQQCQSTEGKNITSHGFAYPKLPTLSLTINSSWLPWGRVAMSLISPLMPVPQITHCLDNANSSNLQARTLRTERGHLAWAWASHKRIKGDLLAKSQNTFNINDWQSPLILYVPKYKSFIFSIYHKNI